MDTVQETKARHGISYKAQAKHNRMSERTMYRKIGRLKRNKPILQKRGPKKIEFDLSGLFEQIRQLPGGPKRTVGLGRLHTSWSSFISRRDIRDLARLSRWEAREQSLATMRRITWRLPGTVWAFDDTHIGYDEHGDKLFNTTGIDLATTYLFEPLTGTPCCGAEIAGHLDRLCRKYGAPLFLKVDNGSNLNSFEVQEVMEHYGIIPLNSPPYYPPYNGTVEHMNGELKSMIKADLSFQNVPAEHKEAYLTGYIHKLNHNERRSLATRHACQFFGNRRQRVTFSKRMRHNIIGEVQTIQQEILGEIDQPNDRETAAAHRRACETVMLKHGLINVHQNGDELSPEIIQSMPIDQPNGNNINRVSPNFAPKKLP
jgi:hypothetical protein